MPRSYFTKGEATGLHWLDRSLLLACARPSRASRIFRCLIDEFGPDKQRLDHAIADYKQLADESSAMALHQAAEAKRQELFRRMNAAPDGLQTLISMRKALETYSENIPNSNRSIMI